MKSRRSSFALLIATFGAALLFANCTVNSADSDCTPGATHRCTCSSGQDGSQVCNSKGTGYGACRCDGSDDDSSNGQGQGGEANSMSGAGQSGSATGGSATGGSATGGSATGGSATGGSATAGTSSVNGGGESAGGAGGTAGIEIDPEDCDTCLAALCPDEWKACNEDPECLSFDENGAPLGQYADIQNVCVTSARVDGNVKRDQVRGCGVTLGLNSDPSDPNQSVWAPNDMRDTTRQLMNCMAMGADNSPDDSWANDTANFEPQLVPWPEGSCAKLACTSKIN